MKLQSKYNINFVIGSILSGAFIHLGFLFSNVVSENILISGIVFSIGIILVQLTNSVLFTSYTRNAVINDIAGISLSLILISLASCFILNFIGIFLIPLNLIIPNITNAIALKNSYSIYELFQRGFMCNFIICMLGHINSKIKDTLPKIVISIMLISCFIVLKMEHSIANMCIYVYGIKQGITTIQCAFRNIAIVASGNLVGGAIISYLLIFKEIKNVNFKNK